MPDLLRVSDRAASRIKKIIEEANEEVIGVIVGVDRTGCSGYAYKLDYAKKNNNENKNESFPFLVAYFLGR